MTRHERIIFMGTPEFAVPALERLIANYRVIAVVTQPDRPAGRSRVPQQSPVKRVAMAHQIPVLQPEKIRRPEAIDALRVFEADAYVVAAFGQILPQTVLDLPEWGSINIHASLLPRWRGAAPIQAAIRSGDVETGITIMKMDAGLDTGPMLSQRSIPIAPDETSRTLHDRLSVLGGELLLETLPRYFDGEIMPQPQDDRMATLAPRIDKADGLIDWTQPADAIERQIRAFDPWPGTYAFWEGRLLKILGGHAVDGASTPGRVDRIAHTFVVGTGKGLLRVARVQLEGRPATDAEAFARGYPAWVGSTLTSA